MCLWHNREAVIDGWDVGTLTKSKHILEVIVLERGLVHRHNAMWSCKWAFRKNFWNLSSGVVIEMTIVHFHSVSLLVTEDGFVDAMVVVNVVVVYLSKLQSKHNLNSFLLVKLDQAIVDIRVTMEIVLWARHNESSPNSL